MSSGEIRKDLTRALIGCPNQVTANPTTLSINVSVCCVNRSLRDLPPHFGGFSYFFKMRRPGIIASAVHGTAARPILVQSNQNLRLIEALSGKVVDLDGMSNPSVL